MKKPAHRNRLALNPHTVRPLSEAQLENVQGGTWTVSIVVTVVSAAYTFYKVFAD
jgi:lactobin A/cerein 7B family class IIb bacteriocin